MIEFDEKIVGVWYLVTIPNKTDWMAAIREIKPDEKYELIYRFRYYNEEGDLGPFNDDKKNWFKGLISGTKNYVVFSLRAVAQNLSSACEHGPVYEVLNDGDLEDFIRRFQNQPFVFVRAMGKENIK
jgi:hypothetical protein